LYLTSRALGHNTLNLKGNLISLEKPLVMAILNITDDSFYKESCFVEPQKALDAAAYHLERGASFLDIGGYSSRPGAKDINVNEELDRILPVVELLQKSLPHAILSIDTFRSTVAEKALASGAHLINDISAGDDDDLMMGIIAKHNCPYIIMHKKGTPQNMHHNPEYKNVTLEVLQYLVNKTHECRKLGIKDVIWDVGIGFGKTIAHNFQLLNELELFTQQDEPLLIGVSRKSLIWKTINSSSENALNGTTALHMACLMKGTKILRVHDAAEAMECISIYNELSK
jgi:dihydropteroate synthase